MIAVQHLLEEFAPVSTAEWEAAITRDLRGADYEKKLIWRPEDGLAVKPYYRAEDLDGLACLDTVPGVFPYRRGTHGTGNWQIREEIDATSAAEANRAAAAAVAAGAEGIAFSELLVSNAADLEHALANLGEIPVHFERAGEQQIGLLIDWLAKRPFVAPISTGCDPLQNLDVAAAAIEQSATNLVPFTLPGQIFEESGATASQEIGFALAAGIDLLAAMEERGVSASQGSATIEFRFSIGANFFFQIAKLHAFRMLWARALESFGVPQEAARARIAACTSRWSKTVYDPHVNILRATTEAMAAVLGGADSVTIAAFDASYRQPDDASRRLARNTQLLLKHEAGLARVADPAGGSYYLEVVTDFLAREAWKTMQEIESRGGYRKAQADGTIAAAVRQSLVARQAAIATRRTVFVGTNQFANPAERALNRIDDERTLATQRATSSYESLRLRTERHAAAGGNVPRVLLAEIGDAKMRTARSNFALNFFACAGFAIDSKSFNTTDEIAAVDADLLVLCAADADYAAVSADLMQKRKAMGRATPVLISGNPANAHELKSIGIADFIHVRSNPLEVLAAWQQRLGIGE